MCKDSVTKRVVCVCGTAHDLSVDERSGAEVLDLPKPSCVNNSNIKLHHKFQTERLKIISVTDGDRQTV